MPFFLTLSLLFILSGCATHEPVAKSNIKGICRSCKPYFVRGAWYYPQLHYDYEETGIASWYGPGFHGKQKACGEVFDQSGVSAAHRTLPLPAVVRVTNEKTGQEVDLVVDDRGPYTYAGRIIDLSVGAAKKVGVYSKGTAKVRVRALKGHSKALAMYLAQHGNKAGVVKGYTWEEIYRTHIVGHYPEDDNTSTHTPVTETAPSSSKKGVHEVIEQRSPDTISDLLPTNVDVPTPVKKVAAKIPVSSTPGATNIAKGFQPKPLVKATGHFIELASFTNAANAQKHLAEVNALAPASIKETIAGGGQKFYVVRCGPYKNVNDAQSALSTLDVLGHNPKLIKE